MFNQKLKPKINNNQKTIRKKAAMISLSEINSKLLIERKEAEILISFLLNKTRETVLIHPEIKINISLYKKFNRLQNKRLENHPIAYLTGQKEFYGLNFKVNKSVLVPRPETEMMVDKIIEETSQHLKDKPLLIDIGTGSGAIIISLAAELKKEYPDIYKNLQFIASDISRDALQIAKTNSKNLLGTKKIKFYRGNLLEPVKKIVKNRNIIIAANLPYLSPAQVKESPSISREPRLALIAGSDGLKYYRLLFKQLQNSNYKSLILFCEIDPSQTKSITSLAKIFFPCANLKIIKDLSERDRFLKITDTK